MTQNLRNTLAWIIFASAVTSVAYWQAQVAVATAQKNRQVTLPPPVKTRHAIRPSDQASPSDPLASYVARRAKGLTDREIGWIVEDFKIAGLDLGVRVASQEEYLAQRQAQDRWYHDALVEGWSLTPEQSAQVTAKLGELFDQAKADFIEALATSPQPFKHNGKWFTVTSAEPIHRLIDANLRLQDATGRHLPWNLCKMTLESNRPPNSDLIINGIPEKTDDGAAPIEPVHIAPAEPDIITLDLLLPKTVHLPEEESTPALAAETGILPQLRKLHPAQLKLLLLIKPDQIKEIETALASTPQSPSSR